MTMTEYQDVISRLDRVQARVTAIAVELAELRGEIRAARTWSQLALGGAVAVTIQLVIRALGGS